MLDVGDHPRGSGLAGTGQRLAGADVDAVAPVPLRHVQRAVGGHHELAGRGAVQVVRGRADGDRDLHRAALFHQHRAAADPPAQPLGDHERVVGRRAPQEDGELLAAVARQHVLLADPAAQPGRDLHEHPVAAGVAVGVVDGLEVVDIGDQHGERVLGAAGVRDLGGEAGLEVAAGAQAGQHVGDREPPLLRDEDGQPEDRQQEQQPARDRDDRDVVVVAAGVLHEQRRRRDERADAERDDASRARAGVGQRRRLADLAHRRVQRGRTEREVAGQPDRVEEVARGVGAGQLLEDVHAVRGEEGEQVRGQQEERGRPAAGTQDQPQRHREHRQVHHRVGERGQLGERGHLRRGGRREDVEPGEHAGDDGEHRRVEQAGQVTPGRAQPDQQHEAGDDHRIVRQVQHVGERGEARFAGQVVHDVEARVRRGVDQLAESEQQPRQHRLRPVTQAAHEHRDRGRGTDGGVEHDLRERRRAQPACDEIPHDDYQAERQITSPSQRAFPHCRPCPFAVDFHS